MQTSSAIAAVGRDALHQDAQLVRRPVSQRLEIAHDAVAAVDGVVQLVAGVAEALAHLLRAPTR